VIGEHVATRHPARFAIVMSRFSNMQYRNGPSQNWSRNLQYLPDIRTNQYLVLFKRTKFIFRRIAGLLRWRAYYGVGSESATIYYLKSTAVPLQVELNQSSSCASTSIYTKLDLLFKVSTSPGFLFSPPAKAALACYQGL
jgi:hypothetical protein